MEHEDPFENLFVFPNVVKYDQVKHEAEELEEWAKDLPCEDAAALHDLIRTTLKKLILSRYAEHLSAFEFLLLIMLIGEVNEVKKIWGDFDKLTGKWVHPPFP